MVETSLCSIRRSKKVGALTQEKSDQPVLEMTVPGKAADEPVGADDVESGGKSHVTRAVPADWSTIRSRLHYIHYIYRQLRIGFQVDQTPPPPSMK